MQGDWKIEPPDWMIDDDATKVLAALTIEGSPVRFVGGCVRDAVLGQPVKDVDIATPDPPSVVLNLLKHAGVLAIPTGVEHGTVTAVTEGRRFEITTLRRDVETFGRRARVDFTADWVLDASRRDFTINALYATPDGEIFDPCGGLADLAEGRVRFVGDPLRRIDEDVLRILRFFRIHAFYGRGEADDEALKACALRAGSLTTLAAERVRAELLRTLEAPDPVMAMTLMDAAGVLAVVLPEATAIPRLARLVAIEERVAGADPLRRLAALVEIDEQGAARLAERLRFSRAEAARLARLAVPPIAVHPRLSERAARVALYRLGADTFRDLVLLAWATRMRSTAKGWHRLLDLARRWVPVELPVGGADVLALGVPSGPAVGALLGALEAWWTARDFKPKRRQCLARLKQLARARAKGGT